MKPGSKGNRPLPILLEDGGDYVEGNEFHCEIFSVSEPKEAGETKYRFRFEIMLKCPPLEKAISAGDAKIYICQEQFTVRRFYPFSEELNIEVDALDLALTKPLKFTPLVVAEKQFCLPYDERYMDPIYGMFLKKDYAVQKRQILGYGNVCNVKTIKVKALSQIIHFTRMETADKERPFSISLDSERIEVSVNPALDDDFNKLKDADRKYYGLINSILAYPIFYQVLLQMCCNSNRYENRKWYNAIVSKINDVRKEKGTSDFDPSALCLSSEMLPLEIWTLCNEILSNKSGLMMEQEIHKYCEDL